MHIRNDGGVALATRYQAQVQGWRLVGLQFEPAEPNETHYGPLVDIGNYSGAHSNIVIDRCYFRVPPAASARRALELSGSKVAVINSYFDLRVAPNVYNPWGGGQGINITSGKGPFKIHNNYVRGVGILLFVNDDDKTVPRDSIDVRRNTFTYNDAFRCGSPVSDGLCRDVRGPIELKRGRRIVFDGNIIENFWSTVSGGQAFIITPRASRSEGFDGNQYGISDVSVTNNIIRNGSGFMQVAGQDDVGYRNTQVTARFNISNNLIYNIDAYRWAAANYGPTRGQILAIAGGAEDITFRHNTTYNIRGTGPAFLHGSWSAVEGLVFTDNILWLSRGPAGGGTGIRWSEPYLMPNCLPVLWANARQVLESFAPGYDFRRNVILGTNVGDTAAFRDSFPYPSENFWPGDADAGVAALAFENITAENFRLQYNSPYKGTSSGGGDAGANIDFLEAAVGRVRNSRVVDVASTSATVVFTPPDSFACAVEASRNTGSDETIRVTATPFGSEQLATIPNLLPATRYYYRVLCAAEQPEGQFSTLQQ